MTRVFAGCVGRFSAAMEHAWLTGDSTADTLREQRRVFLSLLDAVMDPAEASGILAHRIETKMAHARLLTLATFHRDETRAKQARDQSRWHLTTCQKMMLDS